MVFPFEGEAFTFCVEYPTQNGDTFHEQLWETEDEVSYTSDSEESTDNYIVVVRRRVKRYNIKLEAVKKFQSFLQEGQREASSSQGGNGRN